MISTGDIKEKNYKIIGIIGAIVNNQTVQEKKGMFGIKYAEVTDIDTNSMYQMGAEELLRLSTKKGGDAVIYANFEYRIACNTLRVEKQNIILYLNDQDIY